MTQPVEVKARGIETSVGLTWLNRIGVITLVLGIAFFFKHAVDNHWIGETGRVGLGIAGGMAALALAERFWRAGHAVYAQGICGGGIATLYLSFFAAFGFYHLIGTSIAFLLMVATTAAAGALSLRYNASAIAGMALLGGYATPLLLSGGQDRPWFLLSYILLLTGASFLIARLRGWRWLEVLSFSAAAVVFVGWFDTQYTPEKRLVATAFVVLLYGVFLTRDRRALQIAAQVLATLALLAIWPAPRPAYLLLSLAVAAGGLAVADRRNWTGLSIATFGTYWLIFAAWQLDLRGSYPRMAILLLLTAAFLLFLGWLPRRVNPSTEDLTLASLNAAAFFCASYSLLESGRGLLAISLAVVHLVVGYWLGSRVRERAAMLMAAIALCFFTLAIPIQFSAYRITMAWALEGAALAWIAVRVGQTRLLFGALAVFAGVIFRLMLVDSRMYPLAGEYTLLLNARFLTFLTSAVSLGATAWWARTNVIRLATYVAAHVILLWGLVLEVLGWCERSVARDNLVSVETTAISILLAAYAALLVTAGTMTDFAINRFFGLALIGLVILKFYVYDVWLLGFIYKIWACAVLGMLLLVISFIYSRHRSSFKSWLRQAKTRDEDT